MLQTDFCHSQYIVLHFERGFYFNLYGAMSQSNRNYKDF